MKLSEKKKSVAGKMNPTHSIMGTKYPKGVSASKDRMYNIKAYQKGKSSLPPVKHKVDVAGQESYKEEDK